LKLRRAHTTLLLKSRCGVVYGTSWAKEEKEKKEHGILRVACGPKVRIREAERVKLWLLSQKISEREEPLHRLVYLWWSFRLGLSPSSTERG
jgi:hypothetical protein